MKNGMVQHQLALAKAMNSLALVPNSPIIKAEHGILREYNGYHLVIVSRNVNTTEHSGKGRCILVVDPEGKNEKQFSVYAAFIPEESANILLKQIKGFDPGKMPLAFEDLSPFERAEQKFRDNIRVAEEKLPAKEAKDKAEHTPHVDVGSPIRDSSDYAEPTKEKNSSYGQMVVALLAILILTLLGWMKFRK
jgi:hypothetical protein